MADIQLDGLTKRFGKTTVVHGIDLQIADGEFVVLVGPSGCGKSTTLRMIAGLEDITAGTLRIGGEVVNEREPKQRNIAMVFQNYAIYPHLTVAENIGFGLYTAKLSKEEKQQRIARTADMLGLQELLGRRRFPAVSASVSRSAAPWCATLPPSCSTSRCPTSTPSFVPRCASRSSSCTGSWARRWSM